MDILSIIGFLVAGGLMFFGMISSTDPGTGAISINVGQITSFLDVTSIAIVVGGTIAVLMVSFSLKQFAQIPKHLKIIFLPTKYKPELYIKQIVEFATKARINGLLALEEDLENVKDTFMKNSLMMVVDSVEPEKVKQHLETQLDYLDERHAQGRALYDKGASYAPAFGMIGTLIGLINLLKDLSDPTSLGPNMAVALITTFYGTILSNVIFTPISNKLQIRHDEEFLCKMIICEGVQGIQAGENPKFIEERLARLLPSGKYKIQDERDDDK